MMKTKSPLAVRMPMFKAFVRPKFFGSLSMVARGKSSATAGVPSCEPLSTTRISIDSLSIDLSSESRQRRSASAQFRDTMSTLTRGGP